jgi:hypothetical protein
MPTLETLSSCARDILSVGGDTGQAPDILAPIKTSPARATEQSDKRLRAVGICTCTDRKWVVWWHKPSRALFSCKPCTKAAIRWTTIDRNSRPRYCRFNHPIGRWRLHACHSGDRGLVRLLRPSRSTYGKDKSIRCLRIGWATTSGLPRSRVGASQNTTRMRSTTDRLGRGSCVSSSRSSKKSRHWLRGCD